MVVVVAAVAVAIPEGVEAQEVREEYQAVVAAEVEDMLVQVLLVVLVQLVAVGRYGYGIGKRR